MKIRILFNFFSPSDEYLLTATRKLTIDELHQHAQDARLLYHEFWVCINQIKIIFHYFSFFLSRQLQQIISKNFVFVVLVQKIVMVQSLLVRFKNIFFIFILKLILFIQDEHSRVKLPELPGDPLSSYINANYVNGYPNEYHAFIATQGPLANTIIDFYRMIWQEHVPVIVMITRLFEKNKVKK